MKRFVWRLQRILDIKTQEEHIKKSELLKLTERLTQTQGELLARKRMLKNMVQKIAEKNPKERLREQELFLRHSRWADALIRKLQERVKELEDEQRAKIAEVLKLKRFREGLEKLRTQAKSRFIEEQEKLEQKELDEMASIRFTRGTDPLLRDFSDEPPSAVLDTRRQQSGE